MSIRERDSDKLADTEYYRKLKEKKSAKKMNQAGCVCPCHSLVNRRRLPFLPISFSASHSHNQWSSLSFPLLCSCPWLGMYGSSQRHWESNDNNCKEREERRDIEWEKLETSGHTIKYIYFSSIVYLYCLFYTLFWPSYISSNLSLHQFSSFHCHFLNAPTSFSLFVCLSINLRAIGVVELVFPPSDKGFYRMSLTLKGS